MGEEMTSAPMEMGHFVCGEAFARYKHQNFAYICPVCGDFIECGPMNPVRMGKDYTMFVPPCQKCTQIIENLGIVGKTHQEIDDMLFCECDKREIELVTTYNNVGGVIRQLAKWKEEENA